MPGTMPPLPIEAAALAANSDPEFRIAARFWNATLRLARNDSSYRLRVQDGEIVEAGPAAPDAPSDISISAPARVWQEMLAPLPKPFYQDVFAAAVRHGLRLEGDLIGFYPYYPAVRRLIELLREASGGGG